MTKKKVLTAILLIVFSSMLLGCSEKQVGGIKANASISKEYNDVIAVYNKVALSSTSLAKLVNKELDEPNGFSQAFWKEYGEKKEKLLERKENMENYSFQYDEIKIVMKDIDPFLDNVDQYLEGVEAFEKDGSKEELKQLHNDLYGKMRKQSNEIVKTLDQIHVQYIVKKKN